jgi:adenine-specific DNA-methyltransferase
MQFYSGPLIHFLSGVDTQGVIAVCIDENELFHLGMLMDEIFGEDNRLAIINWQKAHSPKNDSRHVSKATEYVLVYSKDREISQTRLLPRHEGMIRSFRNRDGDPDGDWVAGDPTAREHRANTAYAIQSPFTGSLHYPNGEYAFAGSLPEKRAHWTGFTKQEAKILAHLGLNENSDRFNEEDVEVA